MSTRRDDERLARIMTQAAVEAWARQPQPRPSRAGWIVALIVAVLGIIGSLASGLGPVVVNGIDQYFFGLSAHIDSAQVSKTGPAVNSFTFALDLQPHGRTGTFYAVVQADITGGPQNLYVESIPQPGDSGSSCSKTHTKDVCATFPIGGDATKQKDQTGDYQVSIYWVPQDEKTPDVAEKFTTAALTGSPLGDKVIPGGLHTLASTTVHREE